MNQFRLGVVLESLGLPVRAALSAASRLGVQGVQVDATGDLAPDKLGATGRREFRNLLRSFNQDLAALSVPLRHGLDTFATQQQRLDHIKQAMQLAYDLGAKKLTLPLPRIPKADDKPAEAPAEPVPIFQFGPKEPSKAEVLRDSLLSLGSHGDRIGVTVCLEAGVDAGSAVSAYLDGFESGSLRVTFDPANFLAHGHDPLSTVMQLGKRVAHVHGRDAVNAAGGAKEVAAGGGEVEWLGLTAGLGAVDYGGFVCVERTGAPDDVAAGVSFLRRFVPAPK
jgi:L-ribulose-5-phosphate 3-epimerase